MDDADIKTHLEYILKKNYKKKYLGIFTIESFNILDLRKREKCSLILFINNVSRNLGHWVVVININYKLYFIDSYGLSPVFYNKNIKNNYSKINYFLSSRLQSDSTTTCGSYAIFFIHLISYCKYDILEFTDIFLKVFNFNNLIKNDIYIIKYVSKMYPHFNKRKCNKFFCNNKFLSNYKKCSKMMCKNV